MAGMIAAVLLALGGASAPPAGMDRYDERQCKVLKQKIKRIHSRMRAGYSARQGIKLAKKLRELQRKRAKTCR